MADSSAVQTLKYDLAIANRVLFRKGVLDGNGHISVRSPGDPDRLLISRALPPGLVKPEDIVELDLDGNLVSPAARDLKLYSERSLHCEIMRARPDINAVVHSHALHSTAFSTLDLPLRPIFHVAAFLNGGVPVFDPSREMEAGHMMIRSRRLAVGMVERLSLEDALLIRGHGSVVTGKNIPIMVMRALHLENNAEMLMRLLAIRDAAITYLTPDDIRLQRQAEDEDLQWRLWQICKSEEEEHYRQAA